MKMFENDHYLANKAYFSAITVKNIYESLPTRWRQKPAGIEITSLSPCVYRQGPPVVGLRFELRA